MKCPICKGNGSFPATKKNDEAALKKKAAIVLIDMGFGIRETQRILGYKSPRSIQQIIKRQSP